MPQAKVWGDQYRTTLICIDSYENEVPVGRIYNAYEKQGKNFHSLTQLLLQVNDLLDNMNYPQSFTAVRTFSPIRRSGADASESDLQKREGCLATFAVKILFRQNACWQGLVQWTDSGQEQAFRSTLELIFLMNSALTRTEERVS